MCYLSNLLSENSPPPMHTTNQPRLLIWTSMKVTMFKRKRNRKLEKHIQMMILMLEIRVNKNLLGPNIGFEIILQEMLRVLGLSLMCAKSNATNSHKNRTTNLNYPLLHQFKKKTTSVIDPTQSLLAFKKVVKELVVHLLVSILMLSCVDMLQLE